MQRKILTVIDRALYSLFGKSRKGTRSLTPISYPRLNYQGPLGKRFVGV
jgi:hypothetical protein